MKNLVEYINEAYLVKRFDTDDTHCITITDTGGDEIDFNEKEFSKVYKKNKSFYKNDGFVKDIFRAFPDADVIWYNEYINDEDIKPVEYVEYDKQDKGWQEEK